MTKILPLYVLSVASLLSGCATSKVVQNSADEGTMVNSEFHDYITEDRCNTLASSYLRSGKAKTWTDAQKLAAADIQAEQVQKDNKEWAEQARAEKEAKRQESIQRALREVDLRDADSF